MSDKPRFTEVFCACCGEFIYRFDVKSAAPTMQKLCLDCATELRTGKITGPSTLQHGTGGGARVIRDPKGLS